MSRKRIRAQYANATGGGSTPTFGNFQVGPDYGESPGNDGTTVSVATSCLQPAVAASGNVTVTTTPKISAVVTGPPPTINLTANVHGTALGAPFFKSTTTGGADGGLAASVAGSCNVPAGTVDGDLLVAIVTSCATTPVGTTPPAGWTQFATFTHSANNIMVTGYRRIASSEPASYSWTATGGGNTCVAISMTRIVGTDPTTPINVSATGSGNAVSPIAPSVTTTVANCLVLIATAQRNTLDSAYTPPSGWTETYDFQFGTVALNFQDIAGDYKVFAATGATAAQTMTCTTLAASNYVTLTAAIAPGPITLA